MMVTSVVLANDTEPTRVTGIVSLDPVIDEGLRREHGNHMPVSNLELATTSPASPDADETEYVWAEWPQIPAAPPPPVETNVEARIAALESQVQAIQARLAPTRPVAGQADPDPRDPANSSGG